MNLKLLPPLGKSPYDVLTFDFLLDIDSEGRKQYSHI